MLGWSGLRSTFHSARMGTEGTNKASEEWAAGWVRIQASPRSRVVAAQLSGGADSGRGGIRPPGGRQLDWVKGAGGLSLGQCRGKIDQIAGRLAGLQMDKEFNGGQRQGGGRIDHGYSARVPAATETASSLTAEGLGRIRLAADPPDTHQL